MLKPPLRLRSTSRSNRRSKPRLRRRGENSGASTCSSTMRLRLSRGDRGGRRRRHPRDVRDQCFRPRGDDPRRPADHARAKVGRNRQHLFDGRLHRLSGLGLLRRDEIRGRGPLGIALQGGAPFGVTVVIVEPGPFRTDWAGRSLKTPKHPIDAYSETAIARRQQTQGYSGSQPGDPVRAAEAIIATVESPNPPLRLPLGNFAYDAMGAEIEAVRKQYEAVEAAARGAEYPKGA